MAHLKLPESPPGPRRNAPVPGVVCADQSPVIRLFYRGDPQSLDVAWLGIFVVVPGAIDDALPSWRERRVLLSRNGSWVGDQHRLAQASVAEGGGVHLVV